MQLTRITYQLAVSVRSAGERSAESAAAKLTISVFASAPPETKKRVRAPARRQRAAKGSMAAWTMLV